MSSLSAPNPWLTLAARELLGALFFSEEEKWRNLLDVVQDSPRTGLGIPVETKKPLLTNKYTARGTAFRL